MCRQGKTRAKLLDVTENNFSSSVSKNQGNVSVMKELACRQKPLSLNPQHVCESPPWLWGPETLHWELKPSGPRELLSLASPAEMVDFWRKYHFWGTLYSAWEDNDSRRFICLTIPSPVGKTIWEGLKGAVLLEKVCHWWVGFEGSKTHDISN